ncbi:MAG TPA: DUF6438 domain-containing protein [Pyrinomonadaceae bacterium]|nr:DUF6438 domain-containing protein [Pyrinomonadaceae bacterium]
MKWFVPFAGLLLLALTINAQQTYQLKPTPKTVAWGYYDASTPPVLRVKSGDTVEVQTSITSTPSRLEGAGVKPADVEQSLRDIVKEVTNKGPGGHILTGLIFIETAEPGSLDNKELVAGTTPFIPIHGNKGVHAMIPKSIFIAAQDQTGLITLERGVCFGTCPSYIVTLAADGTVTWEGRDFVKTKGKATAHIKPEAFNKLVREFERIKFATLDDKYQPGTPGCGPSATDMPSAQTSINLNGKTKSVLHYYGCRDSEVLRTLTALEHKIDEVIDTEKWIK